MLTETAPLEETTAGGRPCDWLRVREVASILGTSLKFAYERLKDGSIPHCRFGAMIRVSRADVLTYIEKSRR